MILVIYLDRYHLGDPLFLNRFARELSELEMARVVVHGAAESGERLLEAEGGVPVWRKGVLVVGSEAEKALVERAARDLNRRIVHALNDAGVPAVRLDGASRGLIEEDDAGGLSVTDPGWLVELVEQGAVPVVAAMRPSASGPMTQVNGGAVVAALALAFEDAAAVFLSRSPPIQGAEMTLAELSDELLGEPEVVEPAVLGGAEVRLCTERGLRNAGLDAVRLVE